MEKLSISIDVINAWEKALRNNYPEKSFNIVVSCDLDGTEAVTRFYQVRQNEASWMDEENNNLENYKHEAILLLKVEPLALS